MTLKLAKKKKGLLLGKSEVVIINTDGVELNMDAAGTLTMTGSVTFPAAQSVVFDSAQDVNVDFPAVQTIDFNGTQNVQFVATQNVNISSTTGALSVAFDGTQNVNIASAETLNVAFDGTPNVNITAGTIDATITNSSIDIFSTSSNIEQHKISVTDSSTTQNWTNAIKSFIFFNDGDEDVHINFDGVATTNHFKLRVGSSFSVDYATQDTRFITTSGTATIFAIGIW